MSKVPQDAGQDRIDRRAQSTWMGFAQRELTNRGSIRIRIRWGRVGLLFLGLGLGLWTAKSVALFYFFKNVRQFEEVSLGDMFLYPANRGNVRVQQGDYQIRVGKEALDREDYRRAIALFQEGVARSPANLEGRMLLAQIYSGWRPDLAVDLLVDGLPHGRGDRDYVQLTSLLLFNQKEDGQVLELTESLLAEDPPEDIRQILHVARLQAAISLGRYEVARTVFEETGIKSTLDGVLLGTRLYMRVGKEEEATQVLLAVIASSPEQAIEPVYFQLANVLKDRQLYDRAREIVLSLVISKPMEWRPRILLIDILSASGQIERRDREIDALLQQHRSNEEAMTALAQLSAEYGNVRAASRLYEISLENGFNLGLFSLTLAEAYLNSGLETRAIDLCNELVREDPAWLIRTESSFNAIRSLAHFNSGDPELGDLYLRNFIKSRSTTVPQLFQAARSFRKFGLEEPAMAILEDAFRREASHENVLATLIEVEMNLGYYFSIDAHLEHLFSLRRPDYGMLENIHRNLQSDRFLFTDNRMGLLERLEQILAERDTVDWEIWERGPGQPAAES